MAMTKQIKWLQMTCNESQNDAYLPIDLSFIITVMQLMLSQQLGNILNDFSDQIHKSRTKLLNETAFVNHHKNAAVALPTVRRSSVEDHLWPEVHRRPEVTTQSDAKYA